MDFIHNPDYKKIFSFHATIRDRVIARESGWLEFKESFNWLSKDKYAKSMAASFGVLLVESSNFFQQTLRTRHLLYFLLLLLLEVWLALWFYSFYGDTKKTWRV